MHILNKVAIDLDGTLITCQARQVSLLRTIMRSYSLSIDAEHLWQLKRDGYSTQSALETLGFSRSLASNIVSIWTEQVETPYWLSYDQLFLDSKQSLERLVESGIELTLLTARRKHHLLAHQLNMLGLTKYFARIVAVQPNNAANEKARYLSASNTNIYVGDSEADLFASQSANVPCILVSRGQRSERFLKALFCEQIFPEIQPAIEIIVKRSRACRQL